MAVRFSMGLPTIESRPKKTRQGKSVNTILAPTSRNKRKKKYRLIHNGRELSQGLLSEAGKYDAMQILVQKFDEGREDAIDPDEVEVIDVTKEK